MGRPERLEDWLLEAANIMARMGVSLKQAATILKHEVTSDEANVILRRASFNRLLWEARHRYFQELGNDPHFNKNVSIGKLLDLSRKLEEEGEYDKASEVLFKIAKMSGWVGVEGQVNVFADLSQRDLDQIRDKVSKEAVQPKVN
jgi:hypothetical protein